MSHKKDVSGKETWQPSRRMPPPEGREAVLCNAYKKHLHSRRYSITIAIKKQGVTGKKFKKILKNCPSMAD